MNETGGLLTKRTVIGLFVLVILLVGLGVGVFLSQRQTQLKSKADSSCPDIEECTTNGEKWISTGGVDGSNGCQYSSQVQAGSCDGGNPYVRNLGSSGSGTSTTPPACRTTTVCGQAATGDSCSLKCLGNDAAYHCTQADNPLCVADILCFPENNKCQQALPPGGGGQSSGTALTGTVAVSPGSVQKGSNGTYPALTIRINNANTNWKLLVLPGGCSSGCSASTQGWIPLGDNRIGTVDGGSGGAGSSTKTWQPAASMSGAYTVALFDSNVSGIASQTNVTFQNSVAGAPDPAVSQGGAFIPDAAICTGPTFEKNGQVVSGVPLIAGQTYTSKITMQNKDAKSSSYTPNTWAPGRYALGFPTNGDSDPYATEYKTNSDSVAKDNLWGINWADPTKYRIALNSSIPAGSSNTFSFTVTPKQAGNFTFYWGMVHEGNEGKWFGSQCASSIQVDSPSSGAVVPGAPVAPTASGDNSTCKYTIVNANDLSPVGANLISGKNYKAQMTMTNTGTSTWLLNTYQLFPAPKTAATWGVQNISLVNSTQGVNVLPGSSATFSFPLNTPTINSGQAETDAFYFQMANGLTPFGAACEPQVVNVQPPGLGTGCFIASENQSDLVNVNSCNSSAIVPGTMHTYTSTSNSVSNFQYTFNNNYGWKTLYVRFISISGQIADYSQNILYSPPPTLNVISCQQSATGTGTIIDIGGTGFGDHSTAGAGYLKVKGVNAQISIWDNNMGHIQANVPTKLDGEIPIELKIDDGRTATGTCTIGVSNISFTLNTQCTQPKTYTSPDVDLRVIEATAGAKPIFSNKVNISKGVPQSLNLQVQAGRNYSLFVKGPNTLVKQVNFKADQGTKNLGQINLTVGDIFPKNAPDGKINAFDKSFMISQWDLLGNKSGVISTADLNQDRSINVPDYSCQKLGFGQQDDVPLSVLDNL